MQKIVFIFLYFLSITSFSQVAVDSIDEVTAKKHITYLASDKLKGRVNFTKEQLEAARYLSSEFKNYGLLPYPEYSDFYQPYSTHSGITLSPDLIVADTLIDTVLYNVIGILPGRAKADEAIVFSAHYDHVDKGLDGNAGSIFNGANDNASGTTAVLMLAKYFAMRGDNERTIIFCLFSGEEIGLHGSTAFSKLVNPVNVKAVINIEMIGRTNRGKKEAFFITGSRFTDILNVIRKNLAGEKKSIGGDKWDMSGLFYRSDNYPFAKLNIPAHTIMCSDDSEPCYHRPCDDASRIDISNMTKVIRLIAKGCSTLINGQDSLQWSKK